MQPPESDHTVIDGTDTVPLVYQRKQRRGCVRLVRTFETIAHAHTCGPARLHNLAHKGTCRAAHAGGCDDLCLVSARTTAIDSTLARTEICQLLQNKNKADVHECVLRGRVRKL